MKQTRRNNPSGILYLLQNQSMDVMLDAILDFDVEDEFTIQDFAEHSGLVRQSVSSNLDVLVEVGIVEDVGDHHPIHYRIKDSIATRELFALNSALNADLSEAL